MFWLNKSSFSLPQLSDFVAGGVPSYVEQAAYELSVVECAAPFSELVLSWNAATPGGSSATFEARVRYAPADEEIEAAEWSNWYTLGVWGREAGKTPRSVSKQRTDEPISIAIDTLKLDQDYQAWAFQVRLTLHNGAEPPLVRQLAVSAASATGVLREEDDEPSQRGAKKIAVPERSQHDAPPEIENLICSPTSLGMVMAFYGKDHPTTQIVEGVYDHNADIYGNWPFNTAYAGAHGLSAVVRHFHSMNELEQELYAGRPVIASIAFEAGEFPESPTRRTDGHLIVVTGVTADGDFYVNDPDANPHNDQPISRIYSRANLRRAWLPHGGVGYVLSDE